MTKIKTKMMEITGFVYGLAFLALVGLFGVMKNIPKGLQGEENVYTDNVLNPLKIEDYIISNYQTDTVKVSNIRKVVEKNLTTMNYDQGKLRDWYNLTASKKDKIGNSGVCWAATAVTIMKYYGVNAYDDAIFKKAVDTVRDKKYILARDLSGGLPSSKQKPLLENMFNGYQVSKNCTDYRSNIYANHKACIDSDNVDWFSIPEHAMCGNGYVEFGFILEKKDKKTGNTVWQSQNLYVAIVDSTWEKGLDADSYFPCDMIDKMKLPGLKSLFGDYSFIITRIS